MTSSTSSSNAHLLVRATAVFLALFTGYNLAVHFAKPRAVYYQNQWEKNLSLAEDYLLDPGTDENVIVGSSLAARLDKADLGPGYRNLAFSGGTSVTGLEILRRRARTPHRVLVEANVPRDLDTAFVDGLTSPLSLRIKRWLPSARIRNRPVNLALGVLKGDAPPESVIPDSAVFARLLETQRVAHSVPPAPAALQNILGIMARQVEALSAQGTRVVFFQMPIDTSLTNSPVERAIHTAFREKFPPSRFEWIEVPPGEYRTTDGIHLVPQSARDYTLKLRAAAK